MALSIKSGEADGLARELAAATGETITDAVTQALRMRLAAVRRGRSGVAGRLLDISRRSAALPVIDSRPGEEILGYDDHGMPQ